MKVRLAMLAVSSLLISACTIEYKVAIPSNFEQLHPRENRINYLDGVLRQLYFPLIEESEDGAADSAFLDMSESSQLDRAAHTFRFCLKPNVSFSDGTKISPSHLGSSLDAVLGKRQIQGSVSVADEGKCAVVKLEEPRPNFYSELTGVDSTVLKDERKEHLPIGLGPFFPQEVNSSRLSLSNFSGAFGAIDNLVFETVSPRTEGIEKHLATKCDEWNFYQGVVDLRSDSDSRNVEVRPTVKTMVVWTSIKEECLRSRVWSALRSRQSALQKIPVANETRAIPGILPLGVEGSEERTPVDVSFSKSCEPVAPGAVIPLFSVYSQMHSELQQVAKSVTSNLQDVELAFVPLDDDAIMKLMTSGADFVGILSTSSLRSRLSDLLQFLVSVSPGKKLPGLPELLLAIDSETDSEKRIELARQAHRLVLDSGFVLPIGQFNSRLSFPKFVSQVAFRDQFQTSPDYANYRVSVLKYWLDRNVGRTLD